MFFSACNFFVFQFIYFSFGDHYKGGSISWKPLNPYSISGPNVSITITERQSFTFSRYPCNDTIIYTYGTYNDTETATPPTLDCISSTAACVSSGYTTINSPLWCIDFSTFYQITSGTYYTTQSLAINSAIDIAWQGVSWANEILANSWSLVASMNLTVIDGKINTSPVTGSIPIFQAYVGQLIIIQIIVGDVDTDQVTRCRWATQIPVDECGDVCQDLTNASLNSLFCFITWTPVLRAEDVANGTNVSTYVVAIMAEDFSNETSTTPISSVPHQALVYVSHSPPGVCPSKPVIINGFPRRNLACYAVSVNSVNRYTFQANVSTLCPNNSIVDFVSSSPFFTNKSDISQVSNLTYQMSIVWTANSNQTGLQPFCVAAVDNNGQMSTESCVMIMVGGTNPTTYTPTFVQSTASPIGTVLSSQTRFSIQANLPLRRTTINSTYIYIYRFTDVNFTTWTTAKSIDTKSYPEIFFINTTLVFFVPNPSWTPGATYFVYLSQGVATSDTYCGIESGGLNGIDTWRFTIWNSVSSSTTTPSTSTSTATTHTVTTRSSGLTTGNTVYTTTGLAIYTTTTVTTTTTSTTTSVTTTTTTSETTTTTSTTTTTEYIADADVIYPKDFEQDCLQPITIAAALITGAIIPLHLYGMINLFAKMNSNFRKEAMQMRNARRNGLQDALDNPEETQEGDEEDTLV